VCSFFEWKAIKGQKAKQPYAIAMKDDALFGIVSIWENWKEPASSELIRTFAIITTDGHVADFHTGQQARERRSLSIRSTGRGRIKSRGSGSSPSQRA
jgi:hypothetical protein